MEYISSNIGGIIMGAIIGIFLREIWEFIKRYVVEIRELKKKEKWLKGQASPILFSWLTEFYQKRGFNNLLYKAEIGKKSKYIPIFTKIDWYGPDFDKKLSLKLSDPLKDSHQTIDNKFIKRRQEYGQKLWNDSTFFITNLVSNTLKFELELGKADYFQYLSSCGKLQDEAYLNKLKLRKKILSEPKHFLDFNSRTCSLGTICLMAVKYDNTYKFILSARTKETVSYGDKIAAVPCFSFAPFTSDLENEISFKHQIIREFYEELYNKENYLRENRHHSYDFFYEEPQVKRLIERLDMNTIKFVPLGFGIDALNGEPNLIFLILINDKEYWLEEKKTIELNFENKKIFEKAYDDSFLETLIETDNYYSGSVFAISEAIKYIKHII